MPIAALSFVFYFDISWNK